MILFVDTNIVNAVFGSFLMNISAGLSWPLIHLSSDISRLSYDSWNDMMSIMSLFSVMFPNLTKQSYNDLESEQITIGIRAIPNILVIYVRVVLSAMPLSKSVIILYNSLTRTLRMTRLHFVDI